MNKSILLAATVFALSLGGVAAAQACQQSCGEPHVIQAAPLIEEEVHVPLPPHYIVERGPIYDGLGVYAPPRVYAPRVATFAPRYIYGYGVGFSGGPVVVNYVRRHHRRPPLRVYD